jgi:predicted enzyme related to lactoylglutathione lyase
MSHPIVHFELWSPNPEAASKFYSTLFGWKINYTPALSYWLIDTGAAMGAGGSAGGINGGMFKPEQGPLPAKLTFYIGVDDIGAYIRKAVEAGAKVLVPESEIPGVGWSAIVLDPDERAIGLFKPLAMQPTPRPTGASAGRKRPAKKARPAAAARRSAAKKPRAGAATAAKKGPAKAKAKARKK